ncbi:hypothetical protein C8R46DRAFT_925633 [Mycena filopes]|nr:hypothetical protein C8R46DRAFT_925633 [Mycena filopes]
MTESADISKREFLPTIGACVVLTIDPIASLDQDARQDPEVLAACAKLVHKKYVGFIGNRDIFYQPGDPESFAFNVCTVEFLLQGTPKAIQDRCIEPSMSIPILPMTIADHPSSRIPLKPSNPLPWSDCYISPFWGLRVRSRSGFSEDPIDCLLDLEELAKHDRFAGKDLDRHENLCKQAGIPAETPRGPVPRTRDPLVAQERRRLAAEGAQEGIVVPIVDDDDVSSEEISTDVAFNTLFSDVASRPMITVTFSHDLSTVEGFNHPAGFFKELEDLVRSDYRAQTSPVY